MASVVAVAPSAFQSTYGVTGDVTAGQTVPTWLVRGILLKMFDQKSGLNTFIKRIKTTTHRPQSKYFFCIINKNKKTLIIKQNRRTQYVYCPLYNGKKTKCKKKCGQLLKTYPSISAIRKRSSSRPPKYDSSSEPTKFIFFSFSSSQSNDTGVLKNDMAFMVRPFVFLNCSSR